MFRTCLTWALMVGLFSTAVASRAQGAPPDARSSRGYEVLWVAAPAWLEHPAGTDVARTQDELAALVRQISPRAPVPDVDFQTNMVVGYFAGSRRGYWLEVERVVNYRGECVVEVREVAPGAGCMGLAEATYPFILIATHKWPGPVRVESQIQVHDCR